MVYLTVTMQATLRMSLLVITQTIIDPLKFRFRKAVRNIGLVFLFISKCRTSKVKFAPAKNVQVIGEPFRNRGDKYVLTNGSVKFRDNMNCGGCGGDGGLCKAALDLTETIVPLTDSVSPITRAIVEEIHWHHIDAKHKGVAYGL